MTHTLSANIEHVRESIKSLRDTVIEDRKQIMYRIAFAIGLVAFTFKDLKMSESTDPKTLGVMIIFAFIFMFIGGFIFYGYYHKSIDVVARLSKCLAYSEISVKDVNRPSDYWDKWKPYWYLATFIFFIGCFIYFAALVFAILTAKTGQL